MYLSCPDPSSAPNVHINPRRTLNPHHEESGQCLSLCPPVWSFCLCLSDSFSLLKPFSFNFIFALRFMFDMKQIYKSVAFKTCVVFQWRNRTSGFFCCYMSMYSKWLVVWEGLGSLPLVECMLMWCCCFTVWVVKPIEPVGGQRTASFRGCSSVCVWINTGKIFSILILHSLLSWSVTICYGCIRGCVCVHWCVFCSASIWNPLKHIYTHLHTD